MNERDLRVLTSYLGAWGCQTHMLKDERWLRRMVSLVFQLDDTGTLHELAAAVFYLGKVERRRRVLQTVPKLPEAAKTMWPTPEEWKARTLTKRDWFAPQASLFSAQTKPARSMIKVSSPPRRQKTRARELVQ